MLLKDLHIPSLPCLVDVKPSVVKGALKPQSEAQNVLSASLNVRLSVVIKVGILFLANVTIDISLYRNLFSISVFIYLSIMLIILSRSKYIYLYFFSHRMFFSLKPTLYLITLVKPLSNMSSKSNFFKN